MRAVGEVEARESRHFPFGNVASDPEVPPDPLLFDLGDDDLLRELLSLPSAVRNPTPGRGASTGQPFRMSSSSGDKLNGPSDSKTSVQREYSDVTEVSLDRDNRRLVMVISGKQVVVDGVDRLYVDDMPWSEAEGTIRLTRRGRVSINGNVAAVTR